MEIVEGGKALRVRVKNPDRFTAVIPKSHYEGEVAPGVHEILVHWGYEEALVLKNLGIKSVPSPIRSRYSWPGMYTPMKHQRETAEFLSLHKRAFCFDEMGLGKTAAAAWAADYLMSIGQVKRVLVICPVSIMQAAWQQDLFKVLMHRTVGVAHGSKDKRVAVLDSGAEFVIINYDGVCTVESELTDAGFDLIIMDEANCVKNAQARRSKAIKRLIGPDTRVWLMTGTPAAQSPEDAYGLAKLVSPERVPKFFGSWRDMVMQRLTQFKWVPKPSARDTVFNALQPAIRHTKEECLDLPDVVYVDRNVPLTKQQEKYYKVLKEQMIALAAGEEITAVNAASMLNKLLQLSTGAVYSDTRDVVEFDVSPRLEALADVIEESSHKVIVFAPFRHTIQLLERDLQARGYATASIHGDVSAGKRTEIFSSFQYQEDPRVIIIQPQAASHGVTLTAASTVVWFGPTTSLDTYLQANARAHRKGQTNKVTVVHLQGSAAEAKLYKALSQRGSAHVDLMKLYDDVIHG